MNNKTYFISGHLDITKNEFYLHYKKRIDFVLKQNSSFVVGDAKGTDKFAQQYLKGKSKNVIVYHMFKSPRNNIGFKTKGGFRSDNSRDNAMTSTSDEDILWYRSPEEQKEKYGKKYKCRISGTQKNEIRRNGILKFV